MYLRFGKWNSFNRNSSSIYDTLTKTQRINHFWIENAHFKFSALNFVSSQRNTLIFGNKQLNLSQSFARFSSSKKGITTKKETEKKGAKIKLPEEPARVIVKTNKNAQPKTKGETEQAKSSKSTKEQPKAKSSPKQKAKKDKRKEEEEEEEQEIPAKSLSKI